MSIKIVVEKHSDGYVAHALGLTGVVVGQGDTYEAALTDVRSAIAFHIDTLWVKEAEDRMDAYDRGEIKAIPVEEVFKKIRKQKN